MIGYFRFDLMRLMWSADPQDRPTFAELHSSIKMQMSFESNHSEYSYTMAPPTSPLPEYMQPLNSQPQYTNRDSKLYADVQLQPEPDIY